MLKMIKYKKGSPLSITILVILVVALFTTSLVYFNLKSSGSVMDVASNLALSKLYEKQGMIDFYIQEIVSKSAFGVKSKEEFIINFRTNLGNYKKPDGGYFVSELSQIEGQLDKTEFEDRDNKITKVILNLEIEIKEDFTSSGEELFSASYKYNKIFISDV